MIQVQTLHHRTEGFELQDLSFCVPAGAYAVLMGPTGCGKTTLLEVLCGLRACDAGRVLLAGRDVTQQAPEQRGVGYVPQHAALFPRMTVRQNLAFAPAMQGRGQEECRAIAENLADQLGLARLLDRRASRLSGGESQRVALGRALAAQPAILLLDEPLSAVDQAMREELAALLQQVHRQTGATVLHVTHDAWEASRLADLVFEFQQGRIVDTSSYSPSASCSA